MTLPMNSCRASTTQHAPLRVQPLSTVSAVAVLQIPCSHVATYQSYCFGGHEHSSTLRKQEYVLLAALILNAGSLAVLGKGKIPAYK